jgi:NAD-dependent deacetylase
MKDTTSFEPPAGLIKILRAARSVTVLTGAGISAESGLPTFRDQLTGLWAKFNPRELATPQAFRHNPRLVWEWYAIRRQAVAQANPNPGHQALVELERHVPKFVLVTQNVDGLHQRAGNTKVTELHGNIARTKCFDEDTIVESWPPTEDIPPHCPHCGGLLRPDVVWFGEMLPEEALETAIHAARHCDLFFSIGTSGTVEPAASLPHLAAEQGAAVVYINLEVPNFVNHNIFHINGKAGDILPAIIRATWSDVVL